MENCPSTITLLLFISNIPALWSENIFYGYRSLGHLCRRLGEASRNASTTHHSTWDQLHSKLLHQALPPFRESSLNSWKEAGYLQEDITLLVCNPLSLKVWRESEWVSKGLGQPDTHHTCVLTRFSTRKGLKVAHIFSPPPQRFHFHTHTPDIWAALANFHSMEVM